MQPANQTVAYKFDATAGERLYFDVTSAVDPQFWRLIDPFGRPVWGPNYLPSDDVQIQTMAYSGTYTLLVEGRRDAGAGVSNYGLRVQHVSDKTFPITISGTFGADPSWSSGQLGTAIGFNGLQVAEIASDTALELKRQITLETWAKVDRYEDTWTPLIFKGTGERSSERSYALWLNANGSVYFGVTDATGIQGFQTEAGLVPVGEWHHLAAVMNRDSGQLRVLVDGVDRGGAAVRTIDNLTDAQPLRLGANVEPYAGQGNFHGQLDDVRLWNIARSEAEILAAKDAPLAGNEARR